MAITTLKTINGNSTGATSSTQFHLEIYLGYNDTPNSNGYEMYVRRLVRVTGNPTGVTFTSNLYRSWTGTTCSLGAVGTYADTGWTSIGVKDFGSTVTISDYCQYTGGSGTIYKSSATLTATVPEGTSTDTNNGLEQTIMIRYQQSDGTWGEYTTTHNNYYAIGSECSWTLDETDEYEGAEVSYIVSVAATTYLDIRKKGHSFLVKGNLDVNGNVKIGENIMADYIVEQGTSGIWIYRKWSSGIAECWGEFETANIACNTKWETMYETPTIILPEFPFNFIDIPMPSLTWRSGGAGAFIECVWAVSETSAGKTLLSRPNASTMSGYISMRYIGRWK